MDLYCANIYLQYQQKMWSGRTLKSDRDPLRKV